MTATHADAREPAPRGSERSRAIRRRLVTIPGYALAFLLWIAVAPLIAVVALGVDLVRRSGFVALRSAGVVTVYLACEFVGVVASFATWVYGRARGLDRETWQDLHYELEAWWGSTIFFAVVRLFSLRVEIDGEAELGRGPYLLLLRHASAADTLIAASLVSRPHGMRLRYVLKQELLFDPCLDVVGHRVPNVFVARGSDDAKRELEKVRALAQGLGERDGVLIYPEGTRFSEQKRERVLRRLEERDDSKLLDYAHTLQNVLVPRPGGTLALLDASPGADVVVCAHTGFEGAASLSEIWRGALLRRVIRIQFRRYRRADLPTGEADLHAWLHEEWQRVDEWVTRMQAERSDASPTRRAG